MAKPKKTEESVSEQPPAEAQGDAPAAAAADVIVPPPPEAPKAPEPEVKVPKYMVTETKVVSWKGMMTHFHKGTVVSTVTHGDDVLDRLKQSGIKVEPIEG